MEFFRNNFFYLDLLIGSSSLIIIVTLYIQKKIDSFIWRLFWVGVLLGFTWELGCNLQMIFSNLPLARFLTPLPVHWMIIVIIHSFWDGLLFIIGVWFVQKICPSPHFTKFRIYELSVLILWGQIQELGVELASTYSNGWEWIEYWWNPTLFLFNGHTITLFPQLIWLFAVIVFYPIAVSINQSILE